MGLAAVINAACWLGALGVLQLIGVKVSTSLQMFGGRPLDIAWSISLVLGCITAITAGLVARGEDHELAMVLERYAVLFLTVAVVVYAVAIIVVAGIGGSYVVLAFAGSLLTSMIGRQVLVWRQTRNVVREATRRSTT